MGHRYQRKFWVFRCIHVNILEKNRALRAPKTTSWTTNVAVSLSDEKSEDPAKMTHAISDVFRPS